MTNLIDGKDHIRIHLEGATSLGRELSEFYVRPFVVEPFAEFNHLVGYSLWLKTGKVRSQLRCLSPYESLRFVKRVESCGVWNNTYEEEFKAGVKASLLADPDLVDRFLDNKLPLMMYKTYPGDLMKDDRGGLCKIYGELRLEL